MSKITPYWLLPQPSVGNDPEVFIQSDVGFVPGEEIYPYSEGEIGHDNMAIEFRTNPACCLQSVNRNIESCLSIISQKSLRWGTERQLNTQLVASSICRINEDIVMRYPSVSDFGCRPSLICGSDMQVHFHKANPDPRTRIRSAGFHIHLGAPDEWDSDKHLWDATILYGDRQVELIKTADILVGMVGNLISSVLHQNGEVYRYLPSEDEIGRRTLGFGLAGEFRSPEHGIEYRTLGGWALQSPTWTWWANAAFRDAFYLVSTGIRLYEHFPMETVVNYINKGILPYPRKIWELWALLKEVLHTEYWSKLPGGDSVHRAFPWFTSVYLEPQSFAWLEFLLTTPRTILDATSSWSLPSQIKNTFTPLSAYYKGLYYSSNSRSTVQFLESYNLPDFLANSRLPCLIDFSTESIRRK